MDNLQFNLFSDPVATRTAQLFKDAKTVLRVNVSKDEVKEQYLSLYPSEVNQIFRERRHYDGVNDNQFVRTVGSCIFVMEDNTYTTVWDKVDVPSYFKDVAVGMHNYIMSKVGIDSTYFSYPESKVGGLPNKDSHNPDITWTHFYAPIPRKYLVQQTEFNNMLSPVRRGLKTYTTDIIDTVLDLVEGNGLYRGEEYKTALETFKQYLIAYDQLTTEAEKAVFIFNLIGQKKSFIGLRSTVIGTLLDDLVDGKELEDAVKSFEQKVAPSNYKRSSAIVTPRMIKMAQDKVQQLGLLDSLQRRFATETDLNVNDVLFTQRNAPTLNVFEDLTEDAKAVVKEADTKKATELSLEAFINTVVPKASNIELLVESKHNSNFMSLLTAVNSDAPSLFKWSNPFSWSYNGNVTDSLRENVKKFGGDVEGDVRFSLAWSNSDDLDLHLIEPNRGTHIYYATCGDLSKYKGKLDLDMNGLSKHSATDPVENIVYKDINTMPDGEYKLKVHQYSRRSRERIGFTLELEVLGQIVQYTSTVNETTDFVFIKKGKSITLQTLPYGITSTIGMSKEVWGITTNTWTKINNICLSPNYWESSNKQGNKHLFMLIDNCINPESARGFYNEFLRSDLNENRKVFETLASKMKAESTTPQLSGIGFSSTVKNEFFVRVTNTNNSKQTYKVIINGIDV